ncbi:helix-turn-helix domain-containing protein [Gimibacter soli]|uniref:XRE family transcriptional regulator n=1 Tax=Gimibacter soli TaxID=3024400 RepID=A0AAF0BFU8_9PROT|nr:XRE family transcriptional regulator [Gimibacter soli]WCL52888.1 XRE family transcriptional regulator [Gimibacter soli]
MSKSLTEKLEKLPTARRQRIDAAADLLHAEYLTLQELRKAKQLTQVQLAKTLGIRQASIAKMEKRSDLMLSTLRSYVEAMGGRLSLVAEFPGHVPVSLGGLGDTEDPPEEGNRNRFPQSFHVTSTDPAH